MELSKIIGEIIPAFVWLFLALAILIAVGTLCYYMLDVIRRMRRNERDNTTLTEGHMRIITVNIALFGILITAVFFITAFRIDQGATVQEAAAAAQMALEATEEVESRVQQNFDKIVGIENRQQTESRTDLIPQQISIHEQEQGSLAQEGSIATFNFNVSEEANYRIDVEGQEDFDPEVTLFRVDNNYEDPEFITYDDDSGGDLNARIEWNLDSGEYQIRVEEFNGDSGDFEVLIRRL